MEQLVMADVVKNYSDIEKGVEKCLGEREEIFNRRGSLVVPRKYHMTSDQIDKASKRWLSSIVDVSTDTRLKASAHFFNPYRPNGSYYGSIQALYLLGSNEWHAFGKVRGKMQEDMSTRKSATNRQNSWEKFAYRGAREGAASTKDLMGRIVQNFRTLQRLGGINPYAYKLKQLLATVDIRREADGVWHFRLNTSWTSMDLVKPFYDITAFSGVKKGPKGRKVEGKVITSEEVAV
jgi:hypothetical protein